MKTIKKTYRLREITIRVNQREILYDYEEQTVLYTYKGINKNHFKLTGKKWRNLLVKYKLWKDYVFEKYEELEMIIQEINKRGEYHVEFTINNKLYGVSISELKKAYKEVERWQSLGGSNFTIKLIELIAKADKYNKEKILKGFPEVVCAYLIWYWNLPIKKELFEREE